VSDSLLRLDRRVDDRDERADNDDLHPDGSSVVLLNRCAILSNTDRFRAGEGDRLVRRPRRANMPWSSASSSAPLSSMLLADSETWSLVLILRLPRPLLVNPRLTASSLFLVLEYSELRLPENPLSVYDILEVLVGIAMLAGPSNIVASPPFARLYWESRRAREVLAIASRISMADAPSV